MELTWGAVDARLGGASTVTAPDPVLDEFFADPMVARLLGAVTRTLCIKFGMCLSNDLDDMRAEVSEVMLLILTSPEHAARARRADSFPAAVYLAAKNRFAAYTESGRHTGMSGTSSVVRRQRALTAHRARMVASLGREPGVKELVDDFNARMRATRKDPVRQGMVASGEDLVEPWRHRVPVDPVSGAIGGGLADQTRAPFVVDDYPVLSASATHLIAAILSRTAATGGLVDSVARCWLGPAQETDTLATDAEIAGVLRVDIELVPQLRQQVVEVAIMVLADYGMPA